MTLRTEKLTISYGTTKVLDGVSLTLPVGKITALLGPNGCGKSTLLNCFSRLLMPQSGTVFLDDNPINTFSSRQLARRLALLPQHHLTPEDHRPRTGILRPQPVVTTLGASLCARQCAGQCRHEPDPNPSSCRQTVNRSFWRPTPARISGDGLGAGYARCPAR